MVDQMPRPPRTEHPQAVVVIDHEPCPISADRDIPKGGIRRAAPRPILEGVPSELVGRIAVVRYQPTALSGALAESPQGSQRRLIRVVGVQEPDIELAELLGLAGHQLD